MSDVRLILGDCLAVLPTLPADSVDLILTDPPYPKQFEYVWPSLARESARILRFGGSLVSLCGHYQLPYVLNAFGEHLRYWWIGGMGHSNAKRLPGKWVIAQWKPAVWFVKGRRRPGDTSCPVDLLNGGGRDKEFHEWGQAVSWFIHWTRHLTEVGGVVLDPFMGGGTTGLACHLTGRKFIGIEIDAASYAVAEKRILEADGPLFASQPSLFPAAEGA